MSQILLKFVFHISLLKGTFFKDFGYLWSSPRLKVASSCEEAKILMVELEEDFVLFCFVLFFKAGVLCVALAVLALAL